MIKSYLDRPIWRLHLRQSNGILRELGLLYRGFYLPLERFGCKLTINVEINVTERFTLSVGEINWMNRHRLYIKKLECNAL